jgi:argininosuccinate lyase
VWMLAHNASSGMNDLKEGSRVLRTSDEAREMYKTFGVVIGGLVVDPKRSLAEVDADYSTMTEVADTLLRYAEVPFRIGHHYASEITTYGRLHGKRPKDLSDAEFVRIYEQATGGEKLPVPAQRIREALDAEAVVRNRKGLGGTQPEEVKRMLVEHRRNLERSGEWVTGRREALVKAGAGLDAAFGELVR